MKLSLDQLALNLEDLLSTRRCRASHLLSLEISMLEHRLCVFVVVVCPLRG